MQQPAYHKARGARALQRKEDSGHSGAGVAAAMHENHIVSAIFDGFIHPSVARTAAEEPSCVS